MNKQTYPRYYISTGSLSVYYTLRCIDIQYNRKGQPFEADVYVCRLSVDREKAIAAAKAKVGGSPQIVSSPTGRFLKGATREESAYLLPNGRFIGHDVREIVGKERAYLEWYLSEYRFSRSKAKVADKICEVLFSESLEQYNKRTISEENRKLRTEAALRLANARQYWGLIARAYESYYFGSEWERGFIISALSRCGLSLPWDLSIPRLGLLPFGKYEDYLLENPSSTPIAGLEVNLVYLSEKQRSALERILGHDLESLISQPLNPQENDR